MVTKDKAETYRFKRYDFLFPASTHGNTRTAKDKALYMTIERHLKKKNLLWNHLAGWKLWGCLSSLHIPGEFREKKTHPVRTEERDGRRKGKGGGSSVYTLGFHSETSSKDWKVLDGIEEEEGEEKEERWMTCCFTDQYKSFCPLRSAVFN